MPDNPEGLLSSHKPAIVTIAFAICLDLVSGIVYGVVEHIGTWLGLYWSVTTATTVGYGDITPKTLAGHIIAVVVMITIIPLVSATFSLLTSTITSHRVEAHHKKHMATMLGHFKHMRTHLGIPHPEEEF